MDYETGKNFEKIQAILDEQEQKINYLMIKLGEKAGVKKPVKPVAKPVKPEVVETEPETKEPGEEAIEDIVDQEYKEPTVKTPKSTKRWGRKQADEEEEPARIL